MDCEEEILKYPLQSENELICNLGFKYELKNHQKVVNSLDFAKERNHLLTSAYDNSLSVIDIETSQPLISIFNSMFGFDNSIFYNDDRLVFSSSTQDNRVLLWNLLSKELVFSFLGHTGKVSEISVSDKYMLTSSHLEKSSRLWDLTTRTCVHIIQDSYCAAFSNNGKLLASVTYEEDRNKTYNFTNYVNIYSVGYIQNGPFKTFCIEDMGKIHQAKFSSDGLLLFLKDEYNLCNSFNIFDEILIDTLPFDILDRQIKFDLFSLNSSIDYIALGSANGVVNIWNTNNSTDRAYIVRMLKNSENLSCVKFSREKRILATAYKEIAIWNSLN